MNKEVIIDLTGLPKEMRYLQFSPDGKTCYAKGNDGTKKVFNTADWTEIKEVAPFTVYYPMP